MADIDVEIGGLAPEFNGPAVTFLDLKNGIAITTIDFAAQFFVAEGALTYALLDDADAPLTITGLTFDTGTGQLSGTPTVNGTYLAKVRATNETNTYTDTPVFTAAVSTPPISPIFTGNISGVTSVVGDPIFTIDASMFFTGATSYSITPTPPGNWQFNAVTGQLGVVASAVFSGIAFTISGNNAQGSTPSNSFSVTIVLPELDQVVVPDLVGLTLIEAGALLATVGLVLGLTPSDFDDEPIDQIFAQDPAADTLADVGSAVDVTVSLGPEVAEVPPPFVPPPVALKNRRTILLRAFFRV